MASQGQHQAPRLAKFACVLVLSLLLHAAVAAQPNSTSSDSSSSSRSSTTRGRSSSADAATDDDSYVMTTETYTATRKTFVRGPPPADIAAAAAAQLAATAAAQVGPVAPQAIAMPVAAQQQQQQQQQQLGQMPNQQQQQQQQQQSAGWVPKSAQQQGPMASSMPGPTGSSSSRGGSSSGSSSSSSSMSGSRPAAAGDSPPQVPHSMPGSAEAAVAGTPTLVPSFATPPSTASVVTGPQTSSTVSNASKTWKPAYPFPQCLDNTLTYDVSFVGQRQFMQVGSVRYAYHRFGPLRPDMPPLRPTALSVARKDPAPVVFISGWGLTMYMWPIPLLQRLADSREVIIFDNMRTGLSVDNSTQPLSIPLMANSTAALITKLGLNQPDIWSWSVGAFVGYGLLAFHPNKVGNVIIAAGSPGGPDALLPPEPVTQSIARFQQNYTALLPYLFPGGLKDEAVCAFYASYTSFYQSQNLATPLGQKSLLEQSQATVKFFMDPTIITKLGAVPNRVLILHGVQDKLMPVRNALLGAWKLLGSWMLQFPGEGHGIPFSNVQAVITTTLEFFSFANPLSRADMNQWANYGGTASSRMLGQNVTLVVRAEPESKKH